MKIAIISDTHDNLPNTKKTLEIIGKEGVEILLHCGDITNRETLDEIKNNFKGEIKIVKGNGDVVLEELPSSLELDFSGKKIAIVHFPLFAKDLAKTGKYDFVFYGHSHKPWEEKIGDCRLVNPGNIAGLFYRPTFAILDIGKGKLELKIIE